MKNDLQEDYCSFEVSKLLKEKGFEIKCKYFFNEGSGWNRQSDYLVRSGEDTVIENPTHALAIKWIRENFNQVIIIYANASGYCFEIHDSAKLGGSHRLDSAFMGTNESGCWDKFEDATEAALLLTLK